LDLLTQVVGSLRFTGSCPPRSVEPAQPCSPGTWIRSNPAVRCNARRLAGAGCGS